MPQLLPHSPYLRARAFLRRATSAALFALGLLLASGCEEEPAPGPAATQPAAGQRADASPAARGESEAGAPREDEASGGLSARINRTAAPVMRAAAQLMFFDPFAALGLYDPVIYGEDGLPLRDAEGKPREVNFPLVVIWLVFAAAFFSARMRLINFRGFKHAVILMTGRYSNPDSPGEVSHFQALSTALSGTVGLGNIAGVALAVSMGGPGATFWLIVAGLMGMASKFVECTLGVKYREISPSGEVSGGPPYYLSRGLGARGLPRLGRALGAVWAFFAIFGSLGGGNMFQSNQTFTLAAQMVPWLQGRGATFGLVLALLVGLVIIGGIKGIARVTGKIVPLMAVLYVGACLFIIIANIDQIGGVMTMIVQEAFSPPALKGGFIGVMVVGLRRAAFSNEAGVGTAAIAHSAAKTDEPVAEGIVALHEPFVDTVVICTMTALVLIFTGHHTSNDGLDGAALTAAAFGSVFPWFPWVLMVAIVLFSFSTLISFSYYGVKCFDYCFGGAFEALFKRRAVAIHVYRAIFLACVVVGASSDTSAVMDWSDMIIFALILTNTIGLYLLSGEVRRDMISYLRRLKTGVIKPMDPR